MSSLWIDGFLVNLPTEEELNFTALVLRIVYGWKMEKIERLSIPSLIKWVDLAKKRLTVEDCIKIRMLAMSVRVPVPKGSLWKKIFGTK